MPGSTYANSAKDDKRCGLPRDARRPATRKVTCRRREAGTQLLDRWVPAHRPRVLVCSRPLGARAGILRAWAFHASDQRPAPQCPSKCALPGFENHPPHLVTSYRLVTVPRVLVLGPLAGMVTRHFLLDRHLPRQGRSLPETCLRLLNRHAAENHHKDHA